ncbi:MAG: hypothetical protein IPL46_01855 [Saprospiraceae bacterium]|nr:hypothetical protein [Saprospiraceae bacterium]
MERTGNLIELIADPDNLRLAFWKARKGKKDLDSIQPFADSLDENIDILRDQILSGQVMVGDYRYFKIFDPKERMICTGAFREHVLHHALMNVCHQRFEKCQVFDSYASRPCNGVHKSLRRAGDFSKKHGWFLKMDVRKFLTVLIMISLSLKYVDFLKTMHYWPFLTRSSIVIS